MKLTQFFKDLMTSLGCLMIALSLSLFTYPQSRAMAAENEQSSTSPQFGDTVLGMETPDCEKDATNADGTPGVYKPGCDFNEDLAKTDLKNHYAEGVVGIVEQFIGAVFALIGIGLIPRPYIRAVKACPQHMGAKITFPLITAGSISYLAGEIAANADFKNASKMSVDKTFTFKKSEDVDVVGDKDIAQQNKESNQKQFDAFTTLHQIYKKQSAGLSKKLIGAGIAEAAFISAEVIELTDMITNSKTGEVTSSTVTGTVTAQETAVTSAALPATVACPQFVTAVETYTAGMVAYEASKSAKAAEEILKKTSQGITDITQTAFAFGSFLVLPGLTFPVHIKQYAEWQAESVVNTTMSTTYKGTRGVQLAAISSAAATCAATISATCSLTALPPAVGACIAAQTALVTAAITATGTATSTLEATRNTPILCMGTESDGLNDVDAIWAVNYSNLGSTIDQYYPDSAVAINKIHKEEELFFIEKIISNFFHRMAWNKVESIQSTDSVKKLKQLAASTQFAEHLTKEAMKIIRKRDFSDLEKEFQKSLESGNRNLADGFQFFMNNIKTDFIKSAHAGGDVWMDLLMLGVKAAGLYLILGKWLKNHAFPKPKTRAITWGLMTAVNTAILIFDAKSLKEANKRADLVKKEAERFAASHAVNTEYDFSLDPENTNTAPTDPNPYNGENEQLTCAAPKKDGFAPAACPVSLPEGTFKIPRSPVSTGVTGGLANLALDAISTSAQIAATKGMFGDKKGMNGNLNSLNGMKKNLIAKRNKLRSESDARDKAKDSLLKSLTGKSIKSPSMISLQSKFKDSFSGDASKTGVSSGMMLAADDADKKEKAKPEGSRVAMNPSFNAPTSATPSFDFNLDDGNAGGTELNAIESKAAGEENLAEFQINENDIIDKPGVNIFQVISNRYLRSYPVLLEEEKTQ